MPMQQQLYFGQHWVEQEGEETLSIKMAYHFENSARGIIHLRRIGLLLVNEPTCSDGRWWIHRGRMYIYWGGTQELSHYR